MPEGGPGAPGEEMAVLERPVGPGPGGGSVGGPGTGSVGESGAGAGASGAPSRATLLGTLRDSPPSVSLLLLGACLNRAGSFVQLFLVLYLTSMGHSAARAGVALSAFGAGAILGLLVGGTSADRLGPRTTIVTAMALNGVFVGLLATVGAYPALLALAAAAGLTAQAYLPAMSSLLVRLTPEGRLVILSAAYRLAINVGAAAGPVLGALLVVRTGYRPLFVVDMLTCLGFAALALRVLPPGTANVPVAEAEGEGAEGEGAAATSYRTVLRHRRFLLFALSLFLIGTVDVQYLSTLPLAVRSEGLPTSTYGVVVALNALLVIAFEVRVTHALHRRPMRVTIGGGIALIGLGVAGFGLPGGTAALVLATVVWTAGEIVAAPSALAYPAFVARHGTTGRYCGAASASQSLGYAVGPALGTLVWARSAPAAWIGCGVVGLVAALVAWRGIEPVDPAA